MVPLIGRAFVGCGACLASWPQPVAAREYTRLDTYQGVAVRILQSNNASFIHHIIDPGHQQGRGA